MKTDDIYIDYSQEYDKDLHVVRGFGSVSSFIGEDADEPTDIGSIIFNFYNMFSFNQEREAWFSADAISGDEEYIMSAILNENFGFEDGGALVTLDRIVMGKGFQSAELEKMILQQFLEYCNYLLFDYVAVIASKPFSERIKSEKVVEFPPLKMYESFGFISLVGSEKNNPVMIKNLNVY